MPKGGSCVHRSAFQLQRDRDLSVSFASNAVISRNSQTSILSEEGICVLFVLGEGVIMCSIIIKSSVFREGACMLGSSFCVPDL